MVWYCTKMPMDDYDITYHTDKFAKTLSIYGKDVAEDKVRAFLGSSASTWVVTDMLRCITTMRNALSVLDRRYITCIGSRFCHYVCSNNPPVWYLIQVWCADAPAPES